MKIQIQKSFINCIGKFWGGEDFDDAMLINLNPFQLEKLRDTNNQFTRESIQKSLRSVSGDFEIVKDFSADIGDSLTGETVIINWQNPNNEEIFEYNCINFYDED